jgi:hypothetical protein
MGIAVVSALLIVFNIDSFAIVVFIFMAKC